MAALIRTLIVTLTIAGVIMIIFWRVSIDHREREIEELEALNREMEQRLEQREQMIERLSRSRRIAHIDILEQETDNNGEVLHTDLQLIELDDAGREIGRQSFTIPGNVLFVDGWTVKFDHDAVADGHPLKGRTLVLLRRIFSDAMPPRDGIVIDTPGAVPDGYAANDMTRFEQSIWKQFWEIATDAALAREMGVRIAQGEAVYKPVRTGDRYELIVDAAGGMSLSPLERNDAPPRAADALPR